MDPGNYVAVSCTCVGIGPDASTPMLARVVLIGIYGNILLDHFVAPTCPITDYKTETTGIADKLLHSGAVPFKLVQGRVHHLLKGKVLLGHSLWLSLSVLGLSHPARDTRDVALYMPFRRSAEILGLRTLMWQFMQRRCCEGMDNPIENCRAVIDLWRSSREVWESTVASMEWPCVLPPSRFSQWYT